MDIDTFSEMVSHRSLGLSYLEEERYSDALKEFNFLDTGFLPNRMI